jgi:hypothetical protein
MVGFIAELKYLVSKKDSLLSSLSPSDQAIHDSLVRHASQGSAGSDAARIALPAFDLLVRLQSRDADLNQIYQYITGHSASWC